MVRVLDYLAGRPDERFGVSDLARRLELSKPTCLGIVTSLTDAGYLVRDPGDKTYRLGPSLITLGHKAQESMRVSPAAREELRRLSARFGVTAALSGVIDDRITLLDLVAPTGARPGVEVGQSYPFAPPVGLMFVLWDDEAERNWLAKDADDPAAHGHRAAQQGDRRMPCRRLPRRTPDRGRAAAVLVDGGHVRHPARRTARAAWRVGVRHRRAGVPARREHAQQRHDISVISAPVYDHYQRQVMVASMHIGKSLTDAEITERAKALVATADAVTAQLGGVKPALWRRDSSYAGKLRGGFKRLMQQRVVRTGWTVVRRGLRRVFSIGVFRGVCC